MLDIWVALLSLVTAAAIAAWIGVQAGRSTRWSNGLSALALLTASLLLTFPGQLGWATLLPIPAAYVWSRCGVVCMMFAAGIAAVHPSGTRLNRCVMTGMLTVTSCVVLAAPSYRAWMYPVRWDEPGQWRDGVCVQSTEVTCCPAAAATLCATQGIPASEAELARDSFTSTFGTEGLGLYRSLSLTGQRHGFRTIAQTGTLQSIERRSLWPAVALVRFPSHKDSGSLFQGSQEGHAVVIFGRFPDGGYDVGDPAFGRDRWTRQEMLDRWAGGVVTLVRSH